MSTKLMMTVMMIKYHDNDDGDEDGDGDGDDDADGADDDAEALLVQARLMIVMVVVVICRSADFGSRFRRNSVLLSRAFYSIAPFFRVAL